MGGKVENGLPDRARRGTASPLERSSVNRGFSPSSSMAAHMIQSLFRISDLRRPGFIALTVSAAVLALPAVSLLHAPAAAQSSSANRVRPAQPAWFGPTSGNAAQQLVTLLATAQADGLNPKRYDARRLAGLVGAASRGDPRARQQAQAALNNAFVAFVRDQRHDPKVGVIYVDPELRPAPPSPAAILADAAAAPNLATYVEQMSWMNPNYAKLRQALASRLYRSDAERRLLEINRERARALPAAKGRYIVVNAAAQRLYMYEGDQVVDSMRVVAGKPETQTPMMNALMRYVALNPYWNVPPETASHNLAPKILKEGRSYFTSRGYEVFANWSDNAPKIDPMSVDWRAVANGASQIRMRQKPGPANSMGKMKFMFPNKEGIWLHDTPVRERIDDPARLQSGGCVRLEDAARLQRWIFGRTLTPKGKAPEQKVSVPGRMPVYLTYLTAVPSGTSIVYFDDFYGRDRAQARRRG